MKNTNDQYIAARKASAPLLLIVTPDPAMTQARIVALYDKIEAENKPVMLRWDCATGVNAIFAVNEPQAAEVGGSKARNPEAFLTALPDKLASKSVVFAHNLPLFFRNEAVRQATWNLRDAFKRDTRTLVMFSVNRDIPAELRNDVVIIEEPMPTDKELASIVETTFTNAGLSKPGEKVIKPASRAVRGLSAFGAEQALAMSVTTGALDDAMLWQRTMESINATPGLTMHECKLGLDAIAGMSELVAFGRAVINGARKYDAIVFIDEIEKAVSGSSSANDGTSADQLKVLLTSMQNYSWNGMILLGPAGVGKSQFGKCIAGESKLPFIEWDLGGCKGEGLVGQAENAMRDATKRIHGLSESGSDILFIATCNSIASVPPELRRRFKLSTLFVDLPDDQENAALWKLKMKQIGVSGKTVNGYYKILVDTYLGILLYPAHPSFRKKIAQKPKFYFFDPGVQRCLSGTLDIPSFGEAQTEFDLC